MRIYSNSNKYRIYNWVDYRQFDYTVPRRHSGILGLNSEGGRFVDDRWCCWWSVISRWYCSGYRLFEGELVGFWQMRDISIYIDVGMVTICQMLIGARDQELRCMFSEWHWRSRCWQFEDNHELWWVVVGADKWQIITIGGWDVDVQVFLDGSESRKIDRVRRSPQRYSEEDVLDCSGSAAYGTYVREQMFRPS